MFRGFRVLHKVPKPVQEEARPSVPIAPQISNQELLSRFKRTDLTGEHLKRAVSCDKPLGKFNPVTSFKMPAMYPTEESFVLIASRISADPSVSRSVSPIELVATFSVREIVIAICAARYALVKTHVPSGICESGTSSKLSKILGVHLFDKNVHSVLNHPGNPTDPTLPNESHLPNFIVVQLKKQRADLRTTSKDAAPLCESAVSLSSVKSQFSPTTIASPIEQVIEAIGKLIDPFILPRAFAVSPEFNSLTRYATLLGVPRDVLRSALKEDVVRINLVARTQRIAAMKKAKTDGLSIDELIDRFPSFSFRGPRLFPALSEADLTREDFPAKPRMRSSVNPSAPVFTLPYDYLDPHSPVRTR